MQRHATRFAFLMTAVLGLSAVFSATPAVADDWKVDPLHMNFYFKIEHMGVSWVYGRFNDVSGNFTVDKTDPSKSSFSLTIQAKSVDTGNVQRDEHLRNNEFFDVKQFPTITFKSTSVQAATTGLAVTGDFTMHGVTKSITFVLSGGKEANMGGQRIGYSTELKINRSDWGVGNEKMKGALGEEVFIMISFEGVKG